MDNCNVLGNSKSGEERRTQEEMRGPTRNGGGYFGRRPPLPPGDDIGLGNQPVPQWEKKFCTSVCSIPWKKLCETRELMYMYPAIAEWDDSEGEEAFRNAKARYWAKINNLPCPIPLPGPDLYIDTVDHNAILDPELVEDLYKQLPPSQDDETATGIVLDSFQFTTDTVPVTGWGDDEDDPTICATDQSIQIQPTGWGGDEEVPTNYTVNQSVEIQPTGWDDEDQNATIYAGDQSIHIQPSGWNDPVYPTSEIIHENIFTGNNSETMGNGVDYQYNWDYSWQHQRFRNNGHNSRGGYAGNRTTRRYRDGKKANCANEQTVCYRSQWDSLPSFGPKGHGDSSGSRGTWQWQKSVS